MRRIAMMIVLVLIAAPSAAAERTVVLLIDNMTCALCPITVRTAIQRVPGVAEVEVDLDAKTASVVYDDAETTVAEIAEASGAAGYPAHPRD